MRARTSRMIQAIKFGGAAILVLAISGGVARGQAAGGAGLVPADYQRMRSVAQAAISPNAQFVAYTVLRYDRPGSPWPQLWVLDVASGKSTRIGGEQDVAGSPVWSPDSRWIAYDGAAEGKHGLAVVHPDGSAATFLRRRAGRTHRCREPARK